MHMKHCKRKYPDKMSIYSLNTKSNSQKGEGLTQLTWNKESEVGVTVLPQQLCAPAMGWLTLAPVRNGLLLTPLACEQLSLCTSGKKQCSLYSTEFWKFSVQQNKLPSSPPLPQRLRLWAWPPPTFSWERTGEAADRRRRAAGVTPTEFSLHHSSKPAPDVIHKK